MTDGEISAAIAPLSAESERRKRERSRHEKAGLSKRNEREPRCPECKVRLMRDGKRHDGVARYECPKCHRHYSDASNASLSPSKLTPRKIRAILTLITLDCPCWVIAEIADVNQKTAQFWFDRCLDAVTECLSNRIEPKSLLTHDGAGSHNGIVKGLSLSDDWVKFVAGDEECEGKMKLMSNCCPYLRHCFESHNGIKFSKLEAYGSFFLCRWSHVRKHGLMATIDILFNRVCGTPKSDISAKLF